MKKISNIYIIICLIIVASIFLIVGGIYAYNNVRNSSGLTIKEQWIEKQYNFKSSKEALEELKKHYSEAKEVKIKIEDLDDCWIFTSENENEYYTYCKNTKGFGFVSLENQITENEEEEEEG